MPACCSHIAIASITASAIVNFVLCSWCRALARSFPWQPCSQPVGLWRVSVCLEVLLSTVSCVVSWEYNQSVVHLVNNTANSSSSMVDKMQYPPFTSPFQINWSPYMHHTFIPSYTHISHTPPLTPTHSFPHTHTPHTHPLLTPTHSFPHTHTPHTHSLSHPHTTQTRSLHGELLH